MALRVHIPLPGPFSYSARVGARRRRPPTPGGAVVGLMLSALLAVGFVGAFLSAPSWAGGVVVLLIAVSVAGAAAKTRAAKVRAPAAPAAPPLVNGRTMPDHRRWVAAQSPEFRAVYERELARLQGR